MTLHSGRLAPGGPSCCVQRAAVLILEEALARLAPELALADKLLKDPNLLHRAAVDFTARHPALAPPARDGRKRVETDKLGAEGRSATVATGSDSRLGWAYV